MSKVTIIDYGIGNILSVSRVFEHCGAEVVITDSPQLIENAERLVLPGVGAFADGMHGLCERGLIEPIKKFATKERPFLGICLGMQMMMEIGEEFGTHEGLGLIAGRVVPIPDIDSQGNPHKIPHIGWNALHISSDEQLWKDSILFNIKQGESVYFVHSYMAQLANERNGLANCVYNGIVITAAVRSGNLYGCQFHPEKSGEVGLNIIKAFLSIDAC